MRQRITFPRVIIALALLSAVSREDTAPLVDIVAFSLALSLYLIAPATVLAVLLSPFAAAWGVWRYARRRDGHPLPWPLLERLIASADAGAAAAVSAWTHRPQPSEPSGPPNRDSASQTTTG
jgi:hypothetical protein